MSEDLAYRVAELERMLANMVRMGKVTALDEANARVKVTAGGVESDWVPFPAARAGATRTWSAPRMGEQVCLFSPFGDMGQAFAGQSFYQDDHPAPATSKDKETIVFPDGTTFEYNSATNTYTQTVAGSGKWIFNCKEATINAETKVTLNTPLTHCTQALTVDGLLTFNAGMVGQGGTTTATITGNVAIAGNFGASSGTFTHNSKNVGSTHTHINSGGTGTGGVPT